MAPRRGARPSRSTRTKPVISYAESSSSNNSESENYSSAESDSDGGILERPPTRPKSSRASQPSKPAVPSPRKRQRPPTSRSKKLSDLQIAPKKRKLRATSSKPSLPAAPSVVIPSSGIIPPWHSLPYEILLEIFRYASHPIYDEHTFESRPSSRWLLDMASLCRDFSEPALTALYTHPPLVPMVQAHRLVDLLAADPRSMAFKYRQKVESLQIEVSQVAAYTLPGSGLLDIYGLIKDLPRLTALEFYHQKDMAPYRSLEQSIKWTYPENLFDALEHVDPAADSMQGDKTSVCQLRSWRWSSRLAGKRFSIETIPQLHLKPFFASLRKVAFVNYQMPNTKKDQEDPKHEEILAKALENLKDLRHLIFESSTLMNHKLLPLLPNNLRHLELINCWEVASDDLGQFLLARGGHLRCLTLHHNQSLSLSFLPILADACPKLEVLRMNMNSYSIHPTYRSSEPMYEQLLLPDEVPTWPSKLQIIELTQMRKWQTDAAETFFQSLIDSANLLPDLRGLSLQAILNIGWRDRASFRDKWVGSLVRVFKSAWDPPKFHPNVRPLTTSKGDLPIHGRAPSSRFKLRDNAVDDMEVTSSQQEQQGADSERSTRRSTRQQPKGRYTESDEEVEPTIPKGQPRELKRLQDSVGFHGSFTTPPKTPDDSGGAASEHGTDLPVASTHQKGKGRAEEFIQGMCEVVEIRIDNLRPAETQVTEADFLDEEQSGDEDWNEDRDEDEEVYAW